MAEIGEVKEVHSNGRSASFEWRVRDFSQLKQGWYCSHYATYFDSEWFLQIRKRGNGIDYVNLCRSPSTPGTREPVDFSIQCKISDGEERVAVREQKYPEQGWWSQLIVPPWRVPASAGLTLTCSLRKNDSPHATGVSRVTETEGASCSKSRIDEDVNSGSKGVSRDTETEGASCSKSRIDENVYPGYKDVSRVTQTEDSGLPDNLILGEHFKKLLLSGTGHDVLIKVGNKQFRAHKHILEARSPVFAAMFGSDMAEGAGDSVTIEDCDPDSFGQFLQFVYCGRADIASVGGALSLYYAGDKYDFPPLKKMCVEFLKTSFSTTTVFDVVSLAARHDEQTLFQQAIVYFANNLKEVMLTVEWQRFLLANPIEANEMILKALQCPKSS